MPARNRSPARPLIALLKNVLQRAFPAVAGCSKNLIQSLVCLAFVWRLHLVSEFSVVLTLREWEAKQTLLHPPSISEGTFLSTYGIDSAFGGNFLSTVFFPSFQDSHWTEVICLRHIHYPTPQVQGRALDGAEYNANSTLPLLARISSFPRCGSRHSMLKSNTLLTLIRRVCGYRKFNFELVIKSRVYTVPKKQMADFWFR
ncbi:hypothetical protein C8R43DRAFT_962758 [Mycena crocata]|nr:hypothetical protein C8R43DRAFT_962758 [Mycena crocata]